MKTIILVLTVICVATVVSAGRRRKKKGDYSKWVDAEESAALVEVSITVWHLQGTGGGEL